MQTKHLLSFISLGVITLLLFTSDTSSSTANEAGSTALFSDTEVGTFYDEPVESMALRGIIKGYEDGRFGPHDTVTRAQVVTMFDRYDESVVQPLRIQIAKMRELLDLGRCGDEKIQVGEECDDGNTLDGDGCSRDCQMEVRPEPLPIPFPVPIPKPPLDGCVIGGCSGQLCIEAGDEGISTCEWREEYACYQDAICERQGNGKCGWRKTEELVECLLEPGGTSACEEYEKKLFAVIEENLECRKDEDCVLFEQSCPFMTCGEAVNRSAVSDLEEIAQSFIECTENSHQPMACAGCMAMRAICDRGVCRAKEDFIACTEDAKICPDGSAVGRDPALNCKFAPCPGDGDCEPYVCEDGSTHPRCTEDGHPIAYFAHPCHLDPAERCNTYTYDGEPEEYCATCGNGVCETKETCTSSNCSANGACTDDCGPLYCPQDCE